MQNSKQFVLIVNAPPDADQAKVINALACGKERRFIASANRIKWLISDYSAEKTDRDMLNHVLFDLATSAYAKGLSLIVEGSVSILRGWAKQYLGLVPEYGGASIQVNVEAPYEVLVKRFQERVARADAEGKKISIRKVSDLKERYDIYQSLKNVQLPTFDSSVMSPEQIAQEIEKLLV
jgi:hypothetical protein